MDESRFGTHSNTGHGWFPCGKRTTVEISIGYENFYVYSAVSSTNGYNFNLIPFPYFNQPIIIIPFWIKCVIKLSL